jgi:hypothetical protein
MLHSTRTRAFTSSSSCQAPRRLLLSRTVPQRCVVADASLKDTPATLVMEKGELVEFPEQPAVYAVYNKDDQIQYIGLTRKVGLMPAACMPCTPNCTATQHIGAEVCFKGFVRILNACSCPCMPQQAAAPNLLTRWCPELAVLCLGSHVLLATCLNT